jgi:hypothetical protein
MPNKIKIVIASLLVLVLGLVSFLVIQSNKSRDKDIKTVTQSSISSSSYYSYNQNSSSQSLSSSLVSSSVVSLTSLSSNTSKTVSSESQVISSVQKSSKSVENQSSAVISKNENCNLPDSPNLVKTDVGCFELEYSISDGGVFKQYEYPASVENNLFDNSYNRSLLKNIARDYYNRINSKIVSKKHRLSFLSSQKISDSKFTLYISIIDIDYFKLNSKEAQNNPYALRLGAKYSIDKQNSNEWNYNFISIENK